MSRAFPATARWMGGHLAGHAARRARREPVVASDKLAWAMPPLNRSDVRFQGQGRIFPTAVCLDNGARVMKSCKAGGGPLDVG
jgi:hypothetical protein